MLSYIYKKTNIKDIKMKINYDYKQTENYLTEQNMFEFLKDFLHETEIVHDKIVPKSKIRNRPDFRIEDLKLIIEFNGKFHYTNPDIILKDIKKKRVYEDMGYVVKTIPYWIQLRNDVIYSIFKDVIDIDLFLLKDYNLYKCGFIDKNCPLPASFCYLGLIEVKREYNKWDKIIDKYYKYFYNTLLDKIFEKDSFLEVANEYIMPYFVDDWKNKRIGGWTVDFDKFPGINAEIEYLKGY